MDTNTEIKTAIEGLLCPVHKKHPSVGYQKDNSMLLTCCCAEFKIQCFYLVKKMLATQRKEG
jgi:hypothetical protein